VNKPAANAETSMVHQVRWEQPNWDEAVRLESWPADTPSVAWDQPEIMKAEARWEKSPTKGRRAGGRLCSELQVSEGPG
jgi:hypothetical protein